jgi:hypothetical protein
MKALKILPALLLLSLLACKNQDKKSEPMTEDSTEMESAPMQKTYAEISIAEGGEWVDGPRDHKEYSGVTSFLNVNELKVPNNHTDLALNMCLV